LTLIGEPIDFTGQQTQFVVTGDRCARVKVTLPELLDDIREFSERTVETISDAHETKSTGTGEKKCAGESHHHSFDQRVNQVSTIGMCERIQCK